MSRERHILQYNSPERQSDFRERRGGRATPCPAGALGRLTAGDTSPTKRNLLAVWILAAIVATACGVEPPSGTDATPSGGGGPAESSSEAAWQTFKSEQFNIQFEVPPGWSVQSTTVAERPTLTAASPDEGMRLYVYSGRGRDLPTEEVLDTAAGELDFTVTGEKHQESINGMDAWVAEAEGSKQGVRLGLFIAALRGAEHDHVAYIGSEHSRFDANAGVMNRILDSFRELE
jgi:hypothetical protein